MCGNPVPTAIDPALAAVLLNPGLSRAAQLLAPRAGAGPRPAIPRLMRRPGRWLRKVAAKPTGRVAHVLQKEGVRGTATLLREVATTTVIPSFRLELDCR